jgi:hypothetical protein
VPRILITTERADNPDVAVMLDERVATSDLASAHFAGQLIERLGWALADAESSEHAPVADLGSIRGRARKNVFLDPQPGQPGQQWAAQAGGA